MDMRLPSADDRDVEDDEVEEEEDEGEDKGPMHMSLSKGNLSQRSMSGHG